MDRPALDEMVRYGPEVIRAGLHAYREWDEEVEDRAAMVAAVFDAMSRAQPPLRQLLSQYAFELQHVGGVGE